MLAEAPPTRPERPRRRRILTIFGVIAGGLCILLAAALVALHTAPARRFVVTQVTQLLAAENIDFNTDELRYNLFDLSVNLRNVRVRSAELPEPPFATIDRLRLDLSLTALLRRRYVVENGLVEGVAVHYFVDASGRDNLPRRPRDPEQPGQTLDYLIDRLTVSGAKVRYENRQQGIDGALPISTLTIDGDPLTDRHTIQIASAGGTLSARDRETTIERLAGEVELGEDDAEFRSVEMEAAGSQATVSGTLRHFDRPEIDLQVRSSVDLARAAQLADLEEPAAGSAEITATARGALRTPALEARISGSQLRFRNIDRVDLTASGTYDVAERRATIQALDLRAPFGALSGDAVVALDATNASQARLTLNSLDAATLMRAFEAPYRIASRVSGRVNAQWPGLDYARARGQADLTMAPTDDRPSPLLLPVSGRIRADANGTRVTAALTDVRAAGARIDGNVAIAGRERLDGTLRARIENVEDTASAAALVAGRRQGSLPVDVRGAAEVTAHLAGSVTSPDVLAAVRAPDLAVGETAGIALAADLSYAGNAVNIDRADLTWREARVDASGRIGLQGARPIDIAVNGSAIDVPSLLSAAGRPDIPAHGTFTFEARVGGTIARPTATLNVKGRDLVAYEEALGTLTADARLAGTEVTVPQLTLEKPQPGGQGRLTASGRYLIDRRAYAFEVRADELQLQGVRLPDGRVIRGTIALEGNGSGELADPSATVRLIADRLVVEERSAVYEIGRVETRAEVANGQATIATTAPRFSLAADAIISTTAPYPATARLRVEDLDLATLPISTSDLQGQLAATAEARGDLAEPARASATATIAALAGTWHGRPFTVETPATLAYRDERLDVERLRLTAQDSSIEVSGTLPLTDRAGEGALAVDARANLATLSQYLPPDTTLTGDGQLALTGKVRGTLRAIDPDLVLTVDNGLILSPEIEPGLSNLVLRARLAGGEATIEQLTANWGSAALRASGRVPFESLPELPVDLPRKGGPATFTASLVGLNPAAIPGAPGNLSGDISVDAELSATRADLGALEGRITFPALQITLDALTLAQDTPSVVRIASGQAEIEQLALSGSVGKIAATGRASLSEPRTVDARVNGTLDVGAISLFTDQVRAEGESVLQITARGSLTSPELFGSVDVNDANFVIEEPSIAAENVTARLDLDGRRITLTTLDADVNGGTLDGSGYLVIGDGGLRDVNLQFATDDFAFDAPLDLRSLSDANLRISRDGESYRVDGKVVIQEAGLTGDVNFDTGLLAAITDRRTLDITEERNEILQRVQFNVAVDTATPLIVDNNLAQAEVDVNVRVLGTPYETGLSGRLTLLEGAQITLNERRYEAERGIISFLGERRILPSFDLLLNTSASNYDVTIAVTGEPGDTETTLTSSPSLPEPDIMALLVTGRTLDEMRGEEFEVAREQVLSYLAGRLGSTLGRGIEEATGLTDVRLDPNLIANEADPSARLTVAQELTDDLTLVYSTDLANSNDEIWTAEYDVTRRFQTRAVRQSDNSYRMDFRHDVAFGGQKPPRRQPRPRPTISTVAVQADGPLTEAELRELLGVEAGDEYDFFAMRRGVQQIEERLRERQYLQSRVRLERQVTGPSAAVTLRVVAGPQVSVEFEGLTPPPAVREEIALKWHRGVFDLQRADDGVEALKAWLMSERHLQPRVQYAIRDVTPARRQVSFAVDPGPQYRRMVLAFEGAAEIDPDRLDALVDSQDLEQDLFTDPTLVTELLERYYREEGYLDAAVDEPRYEFSGSQARVVVPIREGQRFTIRDVAAAGNSAVSDAALLADLPAVPGDPFLPVAAENSLQHIRDLYWGRGYNDVYADYELVIDRPRGEVAVTFNVEEGPQSVIADIAIDGTDRVSDRLVREQLELETQQPLDLGALSRSRRNLYRTRAFSVVDITRETLEGDPPAAASDEQSETVHAGEQPVRLNVTVREVQPVQLDYGASYDTERGVGGILDISNHNSLGKARVLAFRSRYDGQLREARGSISQPSLRYWPIQTTGTVYYREERNPATETSDAFDVDRKGLSLLQEMELADTYVWSYGFRYERARTFNTTGSLADETITTSPLSSTFTRETRDEVLDATRGSFLSQAFEYSPSWLGSTFAYAKYFGQYFHYFPLQPPERKPFTNEILRPRIVFATGVRLGLARGIGGPVPLSERFFAGGSTSLRGFEQNGVGPVSATREPLGGSALLVLNNELRFPLPLWNLLDGVVFTDIGNVFPRVGEFSLTNLRESGGVGIRVRTPWFLLRGDYGIVFDRRPGEPRSRFYFSIGQAF